MFPLQGIPSFSLHALITPGFGTDIVFWILVTGTLIHLMVMGLMLLIAHKGPDVIGLTASKILVGIIGFFQFPLVLLWRPWMPENVFGYKETGPKALDEDQISFRKRLYAGLIALFSIGGIIPTMWLVGSASEIASLKLYDAVSNDVEPRVNYALNSIKAEGLGPEDAVFLEREGGVALRSIGYQISTPHALASFAGHRLPDIPRFEESWRTSFNKDVAMIKGERDTLLCFYQSGELTGVTSAMSFFRLNLLAYEVTGAFKEVCPAPPNGTERRVEAPSLDQLIKMGW